MTRKPTREKREMTGAKAGMPASCPPGHLLCRLLDRSGLARIHVILACLCALLFVVAILVPSFQEYEKHGQMVACAESLRVVNGALIIQLLDKGEAETLKDAEEDLVSILPGRDGYCPMGGNIYFRKDSNGAWGAVCGLHDSDKKERTRLNASYVLNKIKERVRAAQRTGGTYPQQVTIQLNGKKLVCSLVSEETKFRRGTSTTKGYENEGTVAFYGMSGYGSFGGEAASQDDSASSQKDAGEICYFSFADEDYNATWREVGGWTGSSYGDRY